MTVRATGRFEVKWDEQPAYDEREGATLSRATVTKSFTGDIEGSSVAEVTKAVTGVPGSAGYVAVERLEGSVHGRSGSFVLLHTGLMDRGDASLTVSVVPDSGTGELTGIRGQMVIDVADGRHSYTFDYTLGG
ncbi:DUF3224 domain-containing protein [Thermoactinospora rubra]|uniref:DUF3224 domain-containing protein n=1 Tax=Thermoactinospora rubra TaxID=1088767 RepID=UPI00117C976C|nr:DUF3224 domain-containing protein [Thermoactinospora rubra]